MYLALVQIYNYFWIYHTSPCTICTVIYLFTYAAISYWGDNVWELVSTEPVIQQAFDTEKVSANVYNFRTLQIHLFPQQSVIKDYETYNNKETSFCK